jgi:hypothetical protein
VRLEGLGKLKKFIHFIGSRTRLVEFSLGFARKKGQGLDNQSPQETLGFLKFFCNPILSCVPYVQIGLSIPLCI